VWYNIFMIDSQDFKIVAQKKVRWLLVWEALFVVFYPLIEFGYAIGHAIWKFITHIPAWQLAAIMSLGLTILHYFQYIDNKKERISSQSSGAEALSYPDTSPLPDQKRLNIVLLSLGLGVLAIGGVTKICTGNPPWWLTIVFAAAIPLSFALSGLLSQQSNLPARQSKESLTV
jgi:hypothetical protein